MNRRITLGVCLFALSHMAAADDGTIYVRPTAPFTDETSVERKIIDECNLPKSQMKLLHEEAQKAGVSLTENEEAATANQGKVLLIETSSAFSSGNAFIGHRKLVSIKGRLLDNGAEVGNFTALRNSMGGAFAGYKSSCAVLHRCQAALAKDVLNWLKNPTKDARLGD